MDESWPAWATEPVSIEDPDPAWAEVAVTLVSELQPRLVSWLDGRIEHIGSTAVPGLAAKPIVDVMAPVTALAATHDADSVLAATGWELVPPELDARPWRRFYVLPDGKRRLAHLHLLERAHPRWRDALVFRDVLRERPDLVRSYAELKRAAAASHGDDREAYTAAKSAFVERVVRDSHRGDL